MKINVKILTKEFYAHHGLPESATPQSAALDIRAATFQRTTLLPGETTLLPTGLIFEVPEAVAMLLLPRSGLGHKHGIVLGNTVGLIDPDFREEVMVSLWNRGDDIYYVNPGERIAQALFVPYHSAELVPADTLTETDRKGGFGHSGRS